MLWIMDPYAGGQKMYPVPANRDAVEKAISTDNLKDVASRTTDSDVLLGLALLAQAGNPVRKELLARAIQGKADYEKVAVLLPVMLDGVEESSINDLLRRDPENALGHYLQGNRLHQANRASEALESFRKACNCAELRLYEAITANALFKTLDLLNLKGEDRLCALSWMASRMSNFTTYALQPLRNSLWELAQKADLATRKEISDLLLILAGQLYSTNYGNRWFGDRAIETALQLKAEVAAAENSPTMYGYGAATQLNVHALCAWPGFENLPKPQQIAQFLPSRINRAFAMVDPTRFNSRYIGELNFSVSEKDRPAFDQAKENTARTARALLDLALTDPDGIIGAYLKGVISGREGKHPWFPPGTFVGKLMRERPELFRAAAAHEEAMRALWEMGNNDPERQNLCRMMEIAWALCSYAHAHEERYPDNLDVLFKEGHLKPRQETKSMLTGKPYIYVAAGQKQPAKSTQRDKMVLLYDDHPYEGDWLPCVLASCIGSGARLDQIQEQVRKRDTA